MKTSSKQSRSPHNMSTVFDTLTKIDTEQVISSSMWQNFTDIEKYELPLSPKRPSGKVVHAQFEDTNNGDLYLPAARMTACRVRTRERFISWVKSFAFRYHHQLWDLREHTKTKGKMDPSSKYSFKLSREQTRSQSKIQINYLLSIYTQPFSL